MKTFLLRAAPAAYGALTELIRIQQSDFGDDGIIQLRKLAQIG